MDGLYWTILLKWMMVPGVPRHDLGNLHMGQMVVWDGCIFFADGISWWFYVDLEFYPLISVDHLTVCDGKSPSGWWFGTFFIFPYIGNDDPNWLIFFRGVQTTNQPCLRRGNHLSPITVLRKSASRFFWCPRCQVFRFQVGPKKGSDEV